MAFWETVFAEAADLLKDTLGEFGGDAFGDHPADQALVVLFAGAAPDQLIQPGGG